jgi:hypothetical protein
MKVRNWRSSRPRVEELEGRVVPSTLVSSTNWSGYAVNTAAGTVSAVSGKWVVPAVATNVSGYSSAWVGIDGFSSNSVEQIGTDSDYVNGQAQYYAWYEMYPAPMVKLGLAINSGDTITASVSLASPNTYFLSITDSVSGTSSTTQTSSSAQQSSAEWIQEAPSSILGVLPLANFGTINFSGANATIGGATGPADNAWSSSTLYQINMVTSSGALKATTSALSDSANTSNFSVMWVSSGSKGGGGGGGGHHHTSDQTTAAQQAAAMALVTLGGANSLGTPTIRATAATPTLPAVSVVQPSVSVVPAQPLVAQPAVTVADRTTGDATVLTLDQTGTPEVLPPPGETAAPPADAAPVSPDAVPDSSGDMSVATPVASESADAFFVDARWDSGAVLEAGSSAAGDTAPTLECPGLALTLALGGVWGIATREAAERRQRQRVN